MKNPMAIVVLALSFAIPQTLVFAADTVGSMPAATTPAASTTSTAKPAHKHHKHIKAKTAGTPAATPATVPAQ